MTNTTRLSYSLHYSNNIPWVGKPTQIVFVVTIIYLAWLFKLHQYFSQPMKYTYFYGHEALSNKATTPLMRLWLLADSWLPGAAAALISMLELALALS